MISFKSLSKHERRVIIKWARAKKEYEKSEEILKNAKNDLKELFGENQIEINERVLKISEREKESISWKSAFTMFQKVFGPLVMASELALEYTVSINNAIQKNTKDPVKY